MAGGRVFVAELVCERCGARSYSAVAPRRPDLVRVCSCGGSREVVAHIDDRRQQDTPVEQERRAGSP